SPPPPRLCLAPGDPCGPLVSFLPSLRARPMSRHVRAAMLRLAPAPGRTATTLPSVIWQALSHRHPRAACRLRPLFTTWIAAAATRNLLVIYPGGEMEEKLLGEQKQFSDDYSVTVRNKPHITVAAFQ